MQCQCGVVIRECVLPRIMFQYLVSSYWKAVLALPHHPQYELLNTHLMWYVCRNMALVWHFQYAHLCLNFMFQFVLFVHEHIVVKCLHVVAVVNSALVSDEKAYHN